MDKVAIIIALKNSGGYIKKTIDSIYNSTNYPFKIIIVEVNSTDGTKELCDELAKQHKEIEVYHLDWDKPPQAAINYGIKKAGNLDVFITHDDVIIPKLEEMDWLEELVSEIKEGWGAITGEAGGGTSGPEYLEGQNWQGTWCLYLPRSTIDKVGLFDENMTMGDDIDYSYRINQAGMELGRLRRFWVDHHRQNRGPTDENITDKVTENGIYFKKKHKLHGLIVFMPVYNDLEPFREAVRTLFESTNQMFELIILDGGSTDGSLEFAKSLIKQYPKRVIIFEKNTKTPLEAYNFGFDLAKKYVSDILFIQTDVVFPRMYKTDWLAGMREISSEDGVGAIIPINGGGTSGKDYINGFEWVGGWCTYFPFRTIEKLGGFDQSYPNGYGVDIDYSYAIRQVGLKIQKVNYWVHHHMNNKRTHDKASDTEEQKRLSAEYFRKKWKIKG